MRAAVVTELNGPDGIEIRELGVPNPETGQVRIDVEYAGISFPDVLQTRGGYQVRPELPFTPGWEIAGVVREASGSFRAGDRVAAMPFIGGAAESVVVDANYVFPLPHAVSFESGAALPLNYLTAHFALVRRAQLQPGETVLVQGAAGGVGTACCNMAAAYGATVIAVVSSTEKVATAEAAGAHHVVLADGFLSEVRRLTDGRGVDVVVDPVGGERFLDSLRSLAREGRLVVIGFTGGDIPVVKTNRLLPPPVTPTPTPTPTPVAPSPVTNPAAEQSFLAALDGAAALTGPNHVSYATIPGSHGAYIGDVSAWTIGAPVVKYGYQACASLNQHPGDLAAAADALYGERGADVNVDARTQQERVTYMRIVGTYLCDQSAPPVKAVPSPVQAGCTDGETRIDESGEGDLHTCENGQWHEGPYGYLQGGG